MAGGVFFTSTAAAYKAPFALLVKIFDPSFSHLFQIPSNKNQAANEQQLMTMNANQQVAQMERIIGYTFQDRQLAVEALFHGGLHVEFDGAWVLPERNERIAIVGDNILNTLLIRKWLPSRDGQGMLC